MASTQNASLAPTLPVAMVQAVKDTKRNQYVVFKCSDPKAVLARGNFYKRPLLALAYVTGVIALAALAACAIIVGVVLGGGMGAGLNSAGKLLLGVHANQGFWSFQGNIWGRILATGLSGTAIGFASKALFEKAEGYMSNQHERILKLAVMIHKKPVQYTKNLTKLSEIFNNKVSSEVKANFRLDNKLFQELKKGSEEVLQAQHLLELKDIVKQAQLLSQEIKRSTVDENHPVDWDKYGQPIAWRKITRVTSQSPTVEELEVAQVELKKATDNLEVIFKAI